MSLATAYQQGGTIVQVSSPGEEQSPNQYIMVNSKKQPTATVTPVTVTPTSQGQVVQPSAVYQPATPVQQPVTSTIPQQPLVTSSQPVVSQPTTPQPMVMQPTVEPYDINKTYTAQGVVNAQGQPAQQQPTVQANPPQSLNNNSPRYYKVYGKTYDFDDFQREADEGLSDYIFSLRRGEKDQQKFLKAYSDLMTGILDKTVTYDNGRFHDSQGRYFNDNNPDKDYYGLIANYLKEKQGRSKVIDTSYDPYTDYTKLLAKEIFGSANASDIQSFYDLDTLNEKTGIRPRVNRINVIKRAILASMAKLDPKYTVEERNDLLNKAQAAVNALEDGTIDNGDLYSLSRLAGLPFSKLLIDKEEKPEPVKAAATGTATEAAGTGATGTDATGTTEATPAAVEDAPIANTDYSTLSGEERTKKIAADLKINQEAYAKLKEAIKADKEFAKTVKEKYTMTDEELKNFKQKLAKQIVLKDGDFMIGKWQLQKINAFLDGKKDEEILGMINNFVLGSTEQQKAQAKQFTDLLSASKNITQLNSSVYFARVLDYYKKRLESRGITEPRIYLYNSKLLKEKVGMYYDTENKTVYFAPIKNENSGLVQLYRLERNKKAPEFILPQYDPSQLAQPQEKDKNGNPIKKDPKTGQVIVQKKQQGGSLKYSNIYSKGSDVGYNTYLNKIFNNDQVLGWMQNNYTTPESTEDYAKLVQNNVNTRFRYNVNNYNNGNTYIPSAGIKVFNTGYQNNGNTLNYTLFGNSSEDYNNKKNGVAYSLTEFSRPEKNIKTGDSFIGDKSKDYIDNALGLQTYSRVYSLTDPSLTKFGKWGSYWKSLGNTGAYYYTAPNDPSGKGQWIPTKDTSKPGYKPFDLQGPTVQAPQPQQPQQPQENKESIVTPTLQKPEQGSYTNSVVAKVRSLFYPLSRVGYSIHTNNDVAKTLDRGLRPALINPLDIYSPVTGAFAEKELRNRQAADINRMAYTNASSDSQINLAARQEGNKQGSEYQAQGFLADDQKIRESQKTSFDNMVKSKENRWNVANANTKELINTIRAKSELEAQRLKSNWQSWDNFLQEQEKENLSDYLKDKERRENFELQAAQLDSNIQAENALRKEREDYQAWAATPGNEKKSKTEYPGYMKLLNAESAVNAWKQVNNLGAMAKLYGYKYSHPLLGKKLSFKSGGKIQHSAEYLIYKTIKDALNS